VNTEASTTTERAPPRRLDLRAHGQPGRLITFCGIDGSGKTTMISAVAEHLAARGARCFTTFTPTAGIRKNAVFRGLVEATGPAARSRVDVLGMCLQVIGDLAQHVHDTIAPRLAAGDVVLCDRYVFTTQGEIRARADDPEIDRLLQEITRRLPRPDLAIAMDVPATVAQRRVLARDGDAHKPHDAEFVVAQAEAYLAVARTNELVVLSSERPIDAVFAELRPRLDACVASVGS
jgi:dTMP kinase